MKKKRTQVLYWADCRNVFGHTIHEQHIEANELHLIATFFKEIDDLESISITREVVDEDHWAFNK